MMKNVMKKILPALVLFLLALPAFAAERESAFDRVMRTGVLRCGYYVYPPVTYRDPNTGKLSGFSVDMMEAIAQAAGLKLEWTEEVNFANWTEALQTNRFDAACTPMWPNIPLGRVVSFSIPFMFAGLSPMVRADDERFKGAGDNLARLNQPDVKFIAQDGNALVAVTRAAFDRASLVTLPASMDGPVVVQEIVNKKADAMLGDINNIIEYNKHNPVKLRRIDEAHPVKVQAFTLAVGQHEIALKEFLDNAVREMINDGSIDRLLAKWETVPGQYLRAARPYEAKK